MTVYTWVELVTEFLATSNDIAGFRTALRPGLATREELEKLSRRSYPMHRSFASNG
jgi:hypothetical protein